MKQMIKLFRRMRQNQLNENNPIGRTSKYLLYAIGEIILVVVGILIALQINNSNESRKVRIQELAILDQLKIEFTRNLDQLDHKIRLKKEMINSAKQLMRYIDFVELRNKDSVDLHLARTIPYTTFDPIVNDLARSGELRIISNNRLKQFLSFWTSEIADNREEELTWKHYRERFYEPFLINHYQLRTIRNVANTEQLLDKYLMDDSKTNIAFDIGISRHDEDFKALLDNPNFEDHVERCATKNIHSLNQSLLLRNKIVEILEILKMETSDQNE